MDHHSKSAGSGSPIPQGGKVARTSSKLQIRISHYHLILGLIWFLGPLSDASLAQGLRGSIGGTVTDAGGDALAGVEVTVINEATGSTVQVISAPDGSYRAPQLLPGLYRLKATLSGFRVLNAEHVQVNMDQAVLIDLRLEIGELTETITVEGAAAAVNTESGSVGYVVQNRQILDLPLNGRNVFDLVNLTPASFRIGTGGHLSIAGGRTAATSARLDGVINSRGGLGNDNVEISPPIDSMQEFKVQVNSMSAEFGRTSAGLIDATTKGGANQFHGSVYEFLRNDLFDSKGWGVDQKAPLRRNQFGGTIGGPIRKNQTFFFYNYDGSRERRGVVRARQVPTAAERRGDFSRTQFEIRPGVSGGVLPIYDPRTGQPFPGNVIPLERLDPVARKALDFLPPPNRAPDIPITPAGNSQQNSVNAERHDFNVIRLDHNFTSSTNISGP